MSDVWVEFRWTPTRFKTLHLEHYHGSQRVRCELDIASQQVAIEINKEVREFPTDVLSNDELHVMWGFLDGQICLIVDDHDVFSEPLDENLLPESSREFKGNDRPFAIGVSSKQDGVSPGQGQGGVTQADEDDREDKENIISCEIHDLKIWRDIYYTRPGTSDSSSKLIWTSRLLKADEYLLLGDNSPISVDARQGESGYVKREAIIGVIAE